MITPSKAPCVLIVTGTCGSGKTTVSTLLANLYGWARVSEDQIWQERFGKDRGAFGSDEHRRRRREVHAIVQRACSAALGTGRSIVIDGTVHESPPESYEEYRDFLNARGIMWRLRVLHPRLEVAVARDAMRSTGRLGAKRVASLRAKFTGAVFGTQRFVDISDETPEQTTRRMLDNGAAE